MQSNPKYEAICVPPGLMQAMWPVAMPLFVYGAWQRREPPEEAGAQLKEAFERCKAGTYQLWVCICTEPRSIRAACITEVQDDAVVIYGLAGSDHDLWVQQLDKAVGDFAKAEGKKAVRFNGRNGWGRVLEGNGYHAVRKINEHHSVFERAVS